ncbi:MAG: hypothetical protein JWM11_3634 [Planctomycetaceae bacterium]|nr:hypothetical protein [Planctomycetaceae bacterium]
MQTTTCTTTVGVFTSRSQADKAVDALFDAGFDTNQIGMVTRDQQVPVTATTKTTAKSTAEAENAGTGAATGAAAGAGIGALVGWGVLSGAIPVIGPALFAGTLGVLASNAAGGAAVAGVVGALTGWGVSDEHAKHYESEVAAGRIVVTVNAGDRCDQAREILKRFGATSKDSWLAS